jgi:hypothetical protein
MASWKHGVRSAEPGDPDFIEELFNVAGKESDDLCPFCGMSIEEGEFDHIDMGHYVQVSPSRCDDWEGCGAYELGCYKLDPATQTYFRGWVRDRRPGDEDKYPAPTLVLKCQEEVERQLEELHEKCRSSPSKSDT